MQASQNTGIILMMQLCPHYLSTLKMMAPGGGTGAGCWSHSSITNYYFANPSLMSLIYHKPKITNNVNQIILNYCFLRLNILNNLLF